MSREVANLTERKNPHTPVYSVKESVCLSGCYKLWPQLSQDLQNRMGWNFFGHLSMKSDLLTHWVLLFCCLISWWKKSFDWMLMFDLHLVKSTHLSCKAWIAELPTSILRKSQTLFTKAINNPKCFDLTIYGYLLQIIIHPCLKSTNKTVPTMKAICFATSVLSFSLATSLPFIQTPIVQWTLF